MPAPLIAHRKFVLASGTIPNTDSKATLNSIFDHAYYVKNALTLSGAAAVDGVFTGSIPDDKGGQSLGAYTSAQDVNAAPAATATQPTSGGKFRIAGSGFIDHDNQPGPYYTHQSDIATTFPCEYHFVGLQLQLDPNEAYLNLLGLYLSDLNGGSLRATNNDSDATSRISGSLPIGRPFHVALVYAADRSVSIYIDGVLLGSNITTFFKMYSNSITRLGIGTATNNAKWFSSGMFFINRALTNNEITTVNAAIKSVFNTEVDLQYPIMRNVNITGSGTNTITANSTYYNPLGFTEDVSKRKYIWYGAGSDSGAPDVTNQTHVSTLDNLQSWTKTGYPTEYAANKWFRVDITCTDINGNSFGGAAGVQFYYFG